MMKNYIIIGLGKSGLAAARLLHHKGINFYVFESNTQNKNLETVRELSSFVESFSSIEIFSKGLMK